MSFFKLAAFADEASPQISDQIAAMKRNGVSLLEARNINGTNASDISVNTAKEVRAQLEAEGISVWSIGSPIGKIKITDEFAPHLDQFRHTLDIAHTMGAKCIRMFSFFGEDWTQEKRDEVMLRLSRFVEVAKGSGVEICHENEKGIYGDIAERVLDIHKSIPELKLIFDPANYIQSGQDTKQAWDMIGDAVYYFHVKDALENNVVVPAGYGIGNLPYLVSEYKKNPNASGVLTLEPHLYEFVGLSDLEQEGERTVIGGQLNYKNNDEAFDAACDAIKGVIANLK